MEPQSQVPTSQAGVIRPTTILIVIVAVLLAVNAYWLYTARPESDGPEAEKFMPAQAAPVDLCESTGQDLIKELVPNANRTQVSYRQFPDEGWSKCAITTSENTVFLTVELWRFGDNEKGTASTRAKADFNRLCTESRKWYEAAEERSRPESFDQVCSLADPGTTGSGPTANLHVLDGPTNLWIKYGARSKDSTDVVSAAYDVAKAVLN